MSLCRALIATVALSAIAPSCVDEQHSDRPASALLLLRHVGWGKVTPTTATFTADLAVPASITLTLYDPRGETHASQVLHIARHHQVQFAGLSPGTEYNYQIVVGDAAAISVDYQGRPLRIRTPTGNGSGVFCSLLLADSQGSSFDELVPELESHVSDVELAIFLGDLVAVGDDAQNRAESEYVDGVLGPLSGLTSHLPLYTVLGNHDASNRTDPAAIDQAVAAYQSYLVLPESELFGEISYSFSWDAVRFVALNSVDLSRGQAHGMVGDAQLDWMREQFEEATETWRVVLMHHLVHGWEADEDEEQALWFHVDDFESVHAAFVESGVDLVLNGHRHAFNRVVVDDITYLTVPTIAREQVLFDRYGPADYRNVSADPRSIERSFGRVFGYGVLCAEPEHLSVSVFAMDATVNGLSAVDIPETFLPY